MRQNRGSLGAEISIDQTDDADVMAEQAGRFIRRIEVRDISEPPLDLDTARERVDRALAAQVAPSAPGWDEAWEKAWRRFWRDLDQLLAATYHIEVTDPRWIEHLTLGQAWESAAYA